MGAGISGPRRDEGDETGGQGATLEDGRLRSDLRQAGLLDEALDLQPEEVLLVTHGDRFPQLSRSSYGGGQGVGAVLPQVDTYTIRFCPLQAMRYIDNVPEATYTSL
jgi:hypothetical protein